MPVVQYTFTNKQYTEQHSQHKQYIEQHNSLITKSADRAPVFARYTLAFALQLRKKHGKTSKKSNANIYFIIIKICVFIEARYMFRPVRSLSGDAVTKHIRKSALLCLFFVTASLVVDLIGRNM